MILVRVLVIAGMSVRGIRGKFVVYLTPMTLIPLRVTASVSRGGSVDGCVQLACGGTQHARLLNCTG